MKNKTLKQQISEVLVKWSMPTRQVVINEIVKLVNQREAEVREEIENIFTELEDKNEEFYAGYSQAKYEILMSLNQNTT